MRKESYSEWTIHGALTCLGSLFRTAGRRGLVPANPVTLLERNERPTQTGREKRALSEEEIGKVLDKGDGFRPLVAVLLFTGLRIGEALALTWADIDYEGGFVKARRQLDRKRELVELKTGAGRREVVLVPQLARILREHRLASLHKAPADFLFPSPDGRGRDHRSTARGIERAVQRAGLEHASAHTFRHTFASLLIVGLKLDPVQVSKQLGHSNPATTLRVYSHLFDKARHADETREQLAQGFGHLLAASS